MKNKIYLVAVDGSEWGNRATECATRIAKETGAEIRLITVIPWSGFQPLTLDEISHRAVDKNEEELQARNNILQPILNKYQDSDLKISSEYHWGNPAEVIHKRAKDLKAQLIYVGRRGRSRLTDLILGSIANTLAHTVGVPIVLVP